MERKYFAVATAFLLSLALAACGHSVRKFDFNNSSITPAAAGRVTTNHDRNGNTTVNVRVYHLADPQKLTPPQTLYVVWEQERGMDAKNLGQLKVDKDLNGSFSTTTPDKNFDVFITGENDAKAQSPTGPEVLRTTVKQ